MPILRRIELLSGIATVAAGVAGLALVAATVGDERSGCVTNGSFTYCRLSGPGSMATANPAPDWPGVVLATLLFTPILLGVLGFTFGDSIWRARGSLSFLWLFALLLAAAAGVALLPLVVEVQGTMLPSGLWFLPSTALGLATAVLGTLAARRGGAYDVTTDLPPVGLKQADAAMQK
jgi:hypothetical protein